MCSVLPGLLAADPRSRESALALAGRHAINSRSPRNPQTSSGSTLRNRTPAGPSAAKTPLRREGRRARSAALRESLSPPPLSLRPPSPAVLTAIEAEPAPSREEGGRDRDEDTDSPLTPAAPGAAVAAVAMARTTLLKEREKIDRPPTVKTVGVCTSSTAKSQATGQTAEEGGSSGGVASSVGVGTSPGASVLPASSTWNPATTPRASFKMSPRVSFKINPRASFKMSPRTSRRSNIIASQPLVSINGARQRAVDQAAAPFPVAGTKANDRDGSASSASSTSSSSATAAAAASGDVFFKDQGAATLPEGDDDNNGRYKVAPKSAEPTSDDLEATLLVVAEFRSASESGEERVSGVPTTTDFEATAVDFPVGESRSEVAGKREETASGDAEHRGEEETVSSGSSSGGHRTSWAAGAGQDGVVAAAVKRKKKRKNRVTPLGTGFTNNCQPPNGEEFGSTKEGGSPTSTLASTDGGVNEKGARLNTSGGGSNAASGSGVVHKKQLCDVGLQCARPAETSNVWAGGRGRRTCGCLVM